MAYAQDLNYLRKLLEQEFANVEGGASTAYGAPYQPDQLPAMQQPQMNVLREFQRVPDFAPPPEQMPRTSLEDPRRYKVDGYNPETDAQSQMPINSMRNSQTGEMISLNFGGQQAPQQKLGERIEAEGKMGRYSADGRSIVFPDGSTKDLHPERSARDFARWFEMAKAKQGLMRGDAEIAQTNEQIATSRAARSMREDPSNQTVLDKRFGKAPDGMRWKPDGTLEEMPGGKKEQQGTKALELVDMAETLLDQGPTESLVGTGVDKLAAFFGKSTDGAEITAQLKPIAGQLVAMMPRMEGPQSNYDVKLYQEMAGALADSTVPVEQRKAAIQTIRQLNAKYDKGGGDHAALVDEARKAIARGANREAVLKRLRERGYAGSL
jgi:hypothetical protein